jgi:hypothetical protein
VEVAVTLVVINARKESLAVSLAFQKKMSATFHEQFTLAHKTDNYPSNKRDICPFSNYQSQRKRSARREEKARQLPLPTDINRDALPLSSLRPLETFMHRMRGLTQAFDPVSPLIQSTSAHHQSMKLLSSVFLSLTLLATFPASAAWKYRTGFDKMRGATTTFAEARSKNQVALSFPYQGGSFVEITLVDRPGTGKNAFLWINRGQMPCILGCSFNIKFDKGEVEKWSGSGPADHSTGTIFINNYEDFVAKVKVAKTIVIEVELYSEGTRQFFFDVKDLKWE